MAKFQVNFISYTFQRAVDITVIIPSVTIPESLAGMRTGEKPVHKKDAKYPVLYLLHGYGNNQATWSGYTEVELFAEERNIAVVMFSADNKGYVDQPNGDLYYDFIEKELPDFVEQMFPVSSRAENRYIAGLSMGGFGTLYHAFSNPGHYAAVGVFSGAISIQGALNANPNLGKMDARPLAEKLFAEGGTFPKAYLCCGGKDATMARMLEVRDLLVNAGADVTWDELPEYGHEWRFWNIEIEKFLDFLYSVRTDAFAGQGKRTV